MKLVVLANGLLLGGAQVTTLNYLALLRETVDIEVVVAHGCNERFLKELQSMDLKVSFADCTMRWGYPDLVPDDAVVKSADVFWISDVEYPSAIRLRRVSRRPIVAHLHSYALVCPWWAASYGLNNTCLQNCRNSIARFTSCKIKRNEIRSRWELYNYTRIHKFLTAIKAPLDHRNGFLSSETMKSIDAFVAVSNAVKKIHLVHFPTFGVEPDRIDLRVIYNPVAKETTFANGPIDGDDGRTLVYSSGLQATKGLHVLLKAVALEEREPSNLCVVITRVSPEEGQRVERLIEKTGYRGRFKILGYLSRSELLSLFSRAALVCVPSIWPEPFSNVALEANWVGTPVLASNIGGLPEVVEDGVTGRLVGPGDAASAAKDIAEILAENPDREQIRRYTRAKFNPEFSVRSFLKLLNDLG